MKRREFLARASALTLPLALGGFELKALNEQAPMVRSLLNTTAINEDKILVIIYLNGGNDGLNTVIPLEYYSKYNSLRSNIAIPENQVLRLSGNDVTGLHPAMTGMRQMYNEGKLAIVHSVSYPGASQSHYRSTDILMTGVDSTQYASTGWAGRYLNQRFPNYPENYPNENTKDPLAIQIGYVDTTTLLGPKQPMNVSIQDPNNFYQLLGNLEAVEDAALPCCDAGKKIDFVRRQQALSVGYSFEIKRAADAGANLATYPTPTGTNDLSEQLKIVARLIHGGLQSKIYFVELRGFDTHSSQVLATSNTEGDHAKLLKQLSDGISAFQADLKLQGTEDKVIGMTFSDFGRRANSNLSKGTDHGVAAPMFVFGKGIKRQVIGTNPDLVNDLVPIIPVPRDNNNQDIKMQIDFRQIYTDILNDWFGTPSSVTNSLLFRNFPTTSLFSDTIQSTASGFWADRSVWSAGRQPGPKDYVKINPGHTVSLGENITVRNIDVAGDAELKILGDYVVTTTG